MQIDIVGIVIGLSGSFGLGFWARGVIEKWDRLEADRKKEFIKKKQAEYIFKYGGGN